MLAIIDSIEEFHLQVDSIHRKQIHCFEHFDYFNMNFLI